MAVHVDAIVPDLACERAGKPDHAGLGRRHMGEFGPAADAEGAAHVDDLSALLLEHVRYDEPRAQEHPAQMDLDHAVPCLHRHVRELRGIEHTGVVDQNVDRAELLDGGPDHTRDILDLADIGAHRDRGAAILLDGRHDGVGRVLVFQVVHDDLGALGRKSLAQFPRPSPRLPPVTSATLPASLPVVLISCLPVMTGDRRRRRPSTRSIGRTRRPRGTRTRSH